MEIYLTLTEDGFVVTASEKRETATKAMRYYLENNVFHVLYLQTWENGFITKEEKFTPKG